MEESDHDTEARHVTKSTTSEPQEEFIDPKARPSRDQSAAEKSPPREHEP